MEDTPVQNALNRLHPPLRKGEERCYMCFKSKQLVRLADFLQPTVCKGCWYEIDKTIGFLVFHGHEVVFTDPRLRPGESVDQDGVISRDLTPLPPTTFDLGPQQTTFDGIESTLVPAGD